MDDSTVKAFEQSVPSDAFDKATDEIEKASAILTTLAASYDVEHRQFLVPANSVWLTILAARDLIDSAHAALEQSAR
jgi:hypothetical protein